MRKLFLAPAVGAVLWPYQSWGSSVTFWRAKVWFVIHQLKAKRANINNPWWHQSEIQMFVGGKAHSHHNTTGRAHLCLLTQNTDNKHRNGIIHRAAAHVNASVSSQSEYWDHVERASRAWKHCHGAGCSRTNHTVACLSMVTTSCFDWQQVVNTYQYVLLSIC